MTLQPDSRVVLCFLAFTWFISFLSQPHIPGELEFPDHNADSQQQEGYYERIDAAAVSVMKIEHENI